MVRIAARIMAVNRHEVDGRGSGPTTLKLPIECPNILTPDSRRLCRVAEAKHSGEVCEICPAERGLAHLQILWSGLVGSGLDVICG